METGAITNHIDVAQVVLYVFWLFFAGLIFYLRREDRREGYPLISSVSGRPEDPGPVWMPDPKIFRMSDGRVISAPNGIGDDRPIAAEPGEKWLGAPLVPTGNPMVDGVGPAAYSARSTSPDMMADGSDRIVPMRLDSHFSIEGQDPDPHGMTVVDARGTVVGTIVDTWVDRAEYTLRYLEAELTNGVASTAANADVGEGAGNGEGEAAAPVARAKRVLIPIYFADYKTLTTFGGKEAWAIVRAITAEQFADAPELAHPDRVSLREEDRIMAYFGSGYLYSSADRQEPLL